MRRLTNNEVLFVVITAMAVAPASGRAAPPKDETITTWVQEAIRVDPRVHQSRIEVSTVDGIVTLAGEVESLADKKYGALEAAKIQGVKGVLDRMSVMPSYRFDTDIEQDIRRRLLESVSLKSQDVRVHVLDGQATLTGQVTSWAERDEAELLASEVRGVRAVVNDVEVNFERMRSDDDIRKDVIAALRRDVYLTSVGFAVDVSDGAVTLRGAVGSDYQRRRAERDVRWMQGVRKVDNQLEVEWWETSHAREKAPAPSNDELKESVRLELYEDLRIDPTELKVDASYGHVTLRGTVPTYYQKRLAGQDAHNVLGVAWVSNLLSVRVARRADEAIRNGVQFAFDSDYALSGQGITVRVKHGVVTLSGTVNNPYERAHATELASKIRGVIRVDNLITVNWYPRYTDASLRQRIEKRLAANAETRWVTKQIQVRVANGKATLTGEVNFWSEREEAEKVALLTDGIWAVDNRLTVAGADYQWEDWHYAWPEPSTASSRGPVHQEYYWTP
jgi:osmotically-inducible protein OsmY